MSASEKNLEQYLRVGQIVLVHAKPVRAASLRFRSTVRGWHGTDKIILDRPDFAKLDPLHEGCPCTVRFVSEGTACAFRSFLTHWMALGNVRWCHVDWPKNFETVTFRKHPRISLCVPCTLQFNTTVADAATRDISAGGCCLSTDTMVDTGREVLLDFALPTGAAIHNLRSVVRNVQDLKSRKVVGCEFLPEQVTVQKEISPFIERILARMVAQRRTSVTLRRRLLVIDSNLANSARLCRVLNLNGCETFSAASAIDGFTRLRALGPDAVAVRLEQSDLQGDQIVRLIKSNPAHLTLPVFVFGPENSQAADCATAAGATAYFPESALETGLAEAMLEAADKVVPPPQPPAN